MHGRQGQCIGHFDHGVDHLRQKRGFYPWPANTLDSRSTIEQQRAVTAGIAVEKHRALGIGTQHPGGMLAIANIAPKGRGSAASARARNQPGRLRMPLETHLGKDRFGNIVVGAPVSGALGVGELVHEVTAGFPRQTFGFCVELRRVIHQMALTTIERDLGNLFLRGTGRHHGDERQSEQAREVGFGDCRRAAGGFDHRRPWT
ncbi:hypothetical protein D3C76_1203410 [compost metagenome]